MTMPKLSDFRVDSVTEDATDETMPKLVHITDIEPVITGKILAFDQTITKCGWALLEIGTKVVLRATGMIVPPDELDTGKKIETKLSQAKNCFVEAANIIWEHQPGVVAFEQPPAGGGAHFKRGPGQRQGMHAPEASLLAATVIQPAVYMADSWSESATPVLMVNPQVWQRRFVGYTGDKKAVHAEIMRRYPEMAEVHPNNENTRDAIAIALTASERNL